MEESGDLAPPAGGRRIVVVDDSEDNIVLFQHLLKKIGYEEVVYFISSRSALEFCRDSEIVAPDLFILDVMMPGIDGLALAKMIKSDENMKEASIVFITARELDETLEKCFEVGGADFVSKPISLVELRCRLSRVFEMQDMHRRLRLQNEELRVCTITDALTGAFNRRYLDRRLGEEVAKSARYKHELSFLMLDLDHFKEVNDVLGHLIGDRVLKRFAEILKEAVRSTDMVARYGGEEFCVMLTSTALSRALETAERIRSRVEEEVFLPELSHRDVTVSIGVASYQELGGTVVDFVKSADEAMYEVKSSQRNGVKAAQSSR